MWAEVLARFEKKAPASVMAKLVLEQAIASEWVDQMFEEHRQRQYPRELLFSTIVELMSLVSGSAQRLTPTIEELGYSAMLPGWQLRIVDGNHLPSSEKRLGPLRRERGAARPGFSVVVYDPDLDQVVDLQPCEDAYASERVSVLPLLEKASAGQLWMADRLSGDTTLLFWSNLPDTVSAEQIADLYRRRWSIEGMFQRLESVLESEIETLGNPKAALLGFASAVLAYNVLAVLKRSVEQAHRQTQSEDWEASIFHLTVQVRSGYEGMQIALPSEHFPTTTPPEGIAQRLLLLGGYIQPRQVAKSKRGPKLPKPKEWLEGKAVHAHVSTDRVLKAAKVRRP